MTTRPATSDEITDHGFEVADFNPDAIFWLVTYSDERSGIVVQYEDCFSAQCYNDDQIFDNLNAAAEWLGAHLN